MTHTFDDPSTTSPLVYGDLKGSLLLFEVQSVEEDFPTKFSEPGVKTPAVRANVTVLDGPKSGEAYLDAIVFPKALVSQLRSRVGRMVLGRLGQGNAQPGMNAPWTLSPATTQDKQRAETALSSKGPSSGGTTGSEAPF